MAVSDGYPVNTIFPVNDEAVYLIRDAQNNIYNLKKANIIFNPEDIVTKDKVSSATDIMDYEIVFGYSNKLSNYFEIENGSLKYLRNKKMDLFMSSYCKNKDNDSIPNTTENIIFEEHDIKGISCYLFITKD